MLPLRRALVAVAVVLAVATSACTLMTLRDETREFESSTVLVGRVELGGAADGDIVVGAYRRQGSGWRLGHQTRLHEHGGYELIVPSGEYSVFAYADRNGNGLFDAGEPAAVHGQGRPVRAQGPLVGGLDLVLGGGVVVPALEPVATGSTQAGALADLDAATLAAEEGGLGYWQPLSFFRRNGGNVLFVEPYDPARTPVLFVHGAVGSAQDWRYQIEHLDRRRYQAWLFVYPSGAPVESMSNLLSWKLLNLQLRYRFERLDIVAHSMGGLLVRRCLLDNAGWLTQVRRLVTLSTPWAGESAADSGVRYSPAVVPSWRDMQPEGAFVRSLFERQLPGTVHHALLFGHRGAPGLWRPNNDGTVTLASQLRQAAQQEARVVLGYDEDHTSILASPQVTAQIHTLLDAPAGQDGARIDVRLQLHGAAGGGLPTLLLRPLGSSGTPFFTALSLAEQAGGASGLPAGRYEVGVLAQGLRAEPRTRTVEVGADGALTLDFALWPEGTLAGSFGADRSVPAGARPGGSGPVAVDLLRLRGAGIERTVVPRADDASDQAYADLLAGRDTVWGGSFTFFALPAGDYELELVRRGRPAVVSRHRVVPGVSTPLESIGLDG